MSGAFELPVDSILMVKKQAVGFLRVFWKSVKWDFWYAEGLFFLFISSLP
ncbi:MAG: hypothetical protein KUG79_00170 [Pseudomonadales bacterium]|nr:hypothetical protein [Pseudomonadales bacterium]